MSGWSTYSTTNGIIKSLSRSEAIVVKMVIFFWSSPTAGSEIRTPTVAHSHTISSIVYIQFSNRLHYAFGQRKLYIMIIRSSILYAYPAWATLNPALMSRIRGVQRSVLRTICGADYTTSNKFLHEILNIESVENFSQKQKQQFLKSIVNYPNYLLYQN